MSKQKEIQKWLAKHFFDSNMNEEQCFGAATRKKVWRREKKRYMAVAYNVLCGLSRRGCVLKVDRELPAYCQICSKFNHRGWGAVEPLIEEEKDG